MIELSRNINQVTTITHVMIIQSLAPDKYFGIGVTGISLFGPLPFSWSFSVLGPASFSVIVVPRLSRPTPFWPPHQNIVSKHRY
ncbi:hypothetical protein CCUS01_03564 [Colletotrichum cuscutae]|uniref:Uncharacterized protein n=1 Tax=Colletotrichum cuscutae TaxID=1209917 RepID=A0AAI9VF69_9PEZI|nr:hypothetical protein CCUS01_03564 [Colletotrichum cuscutae]